jgi:uncharacterized SAM-binding protein YcdF (DUF218 family)
VNDILIAMGLSSWKGVLAVLVMPPVPFLIMILVGARLMFKQRLLAWTLIVLSCAALWFSSSAALGKLMRQTVYPVPSALAPDQIATLREAREVRNGRDARSNDAPREVAAATPRTVIVVLGAGQRPLSPEYGLSNLTPLSIERLRYAVWLSRETRLPLAFSGGVGYGGRAGASEAETAQRIAEREFGRPLSWVENQSRDTFENGMLTAEQLKTRGIQRIVLVTHDFHMRRAVRAFERGAARAGLALEIVPAPVGLSPPYEWTWQDYMPSRGGYQDSQLMLHEFLGYLAGA